ncbi:hypothetical protein FA15DRAFT_751571 [Coprinopsis marcescibilis]|uniref:Uncharacterized protein n=1 Tax=Coprinopsis marcescibilis TaxID=230819 RepID=A0A5C3LD22_COPMA|nr:hypothetical protein FA15DRAFT_751571 [Coprinopsis marcescibilis]
MLRTLLERPVASTRSLQRALCISASCSFSSTTRRANEPVGPVVTPSPPQTQKIRTRKASKPIATAVVHAGPLPENKILSRVREIEQQQTTTITLEEVERCRPPDRSLKTTSPKYKQAYLQVIKPLLKSFGKGQLLQILGLYNIERPSPTVPKQHIAGLILKSWDWPAVDEEKRERNYRKALRLTPNEAFFVMTDTENIVSSARRENVLLDYSRESLSLQVKGPKNAVQNIIVAIKELSKEIIYEPISFPFKTQFSDSSLEDISRSSGAFIQRTNDIQLQISFKKASPQSAWSAKQALVRLGYMNATDSREPFFYLSSTNTQDGSYVLLPSVSRQIALAGKDELPTYRLTRVDGTCSAPPPMDAVKDWESSIVNLREWVQDITTGSKESALPRVDVIPGVRLVSGDHAFHPSAFPQDGTNLSKAVEALRSEKSTFHPCVPVGVFDLRSTSNQYFQRLTYSTIPSGSIATSRPVETSFIDFVVASDMNETSLLGRQTPALASGACEVESADGKKIYGHCSQGVRRTVDVVLPDSPIDVRLVVSKSNPQPTPEPLRNYLQEIINRSTEPAHVEPPLYMWVEDQVFVLTSFANVRGGMKEIKCGSSDAPTLTKVFTEISLNNELGYPESICRMMCALDQTEESWQRFLEESNSLLTIASKPATALRPETFDKFQQEEDSEFQELVGNPSEAHRKRENNEFEELIEL